MDWLAREAERDFSLEDQHLEQAFQYQGSLQKALLTLSGGAIALSATLLPHITSPFKSLWMLHWAWYLFIISILITLITYYTRMQYAYFIAAWYQSRRSDKETRKRARQWSLVSNILLGITSLSFMVGLILLTRFCLLNLSAIK